MNNRIAFFDFDGTITKKDTLLEFIKFSKGNLRFLIGFLINSPFLAAYKLKLISNQTAKEKVLRFFFRKTPLELFQVKCDQFAKEILPGLIRPKALQEIEKLKKNNTTIVVVSASPKNWIQKWTSSIQVQLIASKLEIKQEKLTGNLLGKNCHGREKVRRIMEICSPKDFDEVFAYGDTKGDKPMLALAHIHFMYPFS